MEQQDANSETRPLTGFSGIQFKAIGKILLNQGPADAFSIQADPEIRGRIQTEVKNGVLEVKYFSDWKDWTGINLIDKGMPVFNITMQEIKSIHLTGVANLDAASVVVDELDLKVSGPATVTVGTLTVNRLLVEMSGVGSVDLAGKCLDQSITLSGAGNYQASRLESERASVKLSGVGSATVWAKESLDVNISGAGSVEYFGPVQVSQKITGIGVLKYQGDR
jgi:hypothetical protein